VGHSSHPTWNKDLSGYDDKWNRDAGLEQDGMSVIECTSNK
jgi:hypothetical protein